MIDAAWIEYWAGKYPPKKDLKVLDEVGPRVRDRGYYDLQDLLEVGDWKSPRIKPLLRKNTEAMIRDLSSTAFAAPLPVRHLVLGLLEGVKTPMASALLMVWQPETHTVIDVRARDSLVNNGEIPRPRNKYPPYLDYLNVCKEISERCGCDLRKLDRALYMADGAVEGSG